MASKDDKELKPTKQKSVFSDYTSDFKDKLVEAAEEQTKLVEAWKKFWEVWIPGGYRKRKRYRTPGHGKRKGINRRRNKAARAMRKTQRRKKGK